MVKRITALALAILVSIVVGCATGAAQIREAYVKKGQTSSSFFDDFCAAVIDQGVTCVENRQNEWEFMGKYGNAEIMISGILTYAAGDPAYKIKPAFKSFEIPGETSAQEKFWTGVMDSLQKKRGYQHISELEYETSEKAFLAKQAADDEKEQKRVTRILSTLATARSCKGLKSSYLKCARSIVSDRTKTENSIWSDLKSTESLIPGASCQVICSVEILQGCQQAGITRFPNDFLENKICMATCEKCWFP